MFMLKDKARIKVILGVKRREIMRELDCKVSVANEILQSYWEDILPEIEYNPQLVLEI